MELISTHIGADFDGFAAMIAARKLHPGARLFFPGSREESLRRMLEGRRMEVEELRHKDVDPAALTRVILCDIRQRYRIGSWPSGWRDICRAVLTCRKQREYSPLDSLLPRSSSGDKTLGKTPARQ